MSDDLFENAVRCGRFSADEEVLERGASGTVAQIVSHAVRGALSGLLANGVIMLTEEPPPWYQPGKRLGDGEAPQ